LKKETTHLIGWTKDIPWDFRSCNILTENGLQIKYNLAANKPSMNLF